MYFENGSQNDDFICNGVKLPKQMSLIFNQISGIFVTKKKQKKTKTRKQMQAQKFLKNEVAKI